VTGHPWLYDPTKTTYLGVRAQQLWTDLVIWEKFFQEQPIKSVIELGTLKGGMSLFLLAQCMQRGIEFWTMDMNTEPDDTPVAQALGLKRRFLRMNIFGDGQPWIEQMIASTLFKPLLLFCDGGNKVAEVLTFSPMLKTGDFVVVHDWMWEIGPKNLEGQIPFLEPVYLLECEALNSMTRFWRRL